MEKDCRFTVLKYIAKLLNGVRTLVGSDAVVTGEIKELENLKDPSETIQFWNESVKNTRYLANELSGRSLEF